MRKTMILLTAAGAALSLTLAPTGSALAANGSVIDEGQCIDLGGGFTECFFVKGETNNLLTPSGYFMFEDNTRFGVTVIGPDFNETQTGTEHLQELVKNDATVKEMHDRSVAVLHFQSGSFVQDCTFSQIFHYANGQIQYDRSNAVCTSP